MRFLAKRSKKSQNRDSDMDEYNDMDHERVGRDEEDYAESDGYDDSDREDEDDEEKGTDEEWKNDGHKDDEMERLEKVYIDICHQEQNILNNLKRHKDDDLLKGQAVKNQKALWYKILELRFLLQKPFSNSNRLPQGPVRSSFCDSDEGVSAAYSDLITSSKETLDSILELQGILVMKNPAIVQSTDGSDTPFKHLEVSEHLDDYEEWSKISKMHKRIIAFRDKSINKWQRMTQVTTGAAAIKGKLNAFNQDISDQVATCMRDPSRMIKQMQLRRSASSIFGSYLQIPEVKDNTKEEARDDGDPELLDDTEYYQQLLKEFFETVDPTSSEATFYALKKLQPKKRKIVDRRASKSRKIRYRVHEKIVNFMAHQPMDLPDMAPKLFDNLFGLKTSRSMTAAS